MRVTPALLLIPILTFIIFVSIDTDASIEFDMVCPTESEGFALMNNGYRSQDLRGWMVSDGEGTITFTKSLVLRPGESVTIMSEEPGDWMQLESYILYGESGVKNDKFALSDKGDELHLIDADGETVDSFCYGESDGVDPFPRIPKKHVALRNHAYGYPGESESWILHVPGRTLYHFERTFEDCEVIPFSFPESDGDEILSCIQGAKNRIRISMYTFDNKDVASALVYAMGRGVGLSILIEGSPAGGIDSEQIRVMTTLWKNGADIKVISSQDSYKRYQYVHNKYAVIDDRITIITSENWTDSAFSSNRGWGACIIDEGCAGYLSEIFDSDFSDRGDLSDFRERFASALPYALKEHVPIEKEFDTIVADVTPVISPDYSYKSLKKFITSAEVRIYSQQLNVQYDWIDDNDNPLQWMRERGSKGVDSRLLVDVTYDSPYDDDDKDGYGLFATYRYDTDFQVRYYIPTVHGMMHNKGIVVDDSVWIGSMNWTDNSISSNREVSVIVRSERISDIFTSLFLEDWGMDFDGTVDIVITVPEATRSESITLDASESSVPFGSTFSWNLDDDEDIERTGKMVDWKFYEDTECTVYVMDLDGNMYTKMFTVRLKEQEERGPEREEGGFILEGPIKYVPLIVIIGGIVLIRRLTIK